MMQDNTPPATPDAAPANDPSPPARPSEAPAESPIPQDPIDIPSPSSPGTDAPTTPISPIA